MTTLKIGDRVRWEDARAGMVVALTGHDKDGEVFNGTPLTLVRCNAARERWNVSGGSGSWLVRQRFDDDSAGLHLVSLPEAPREEGNATETGRSICICTRHPPGVSCTIGAGERLWESDDGHFHCLACGGHRCEYSRCPFPPATAPAPTMPPGRMAEVVASSAPAPVAWDGIPSKPEPRSRAACPCHGYPAGRCTVWAWEERQRSAVDANAAARTESDTKQVSHSRMIWTGEWTASGVIRAGVYTLRRGEWVHEDDPPRPEDNPLVAAEFKVLP